METASFRHLDLVGAVDARGRDPAGRLAATRRAEFGQFFTPGPVAQFMASLVRVPEEGSLTVLDPGAGVGCL